MGLLKVIFTCVSLATFVGCSSSSADDAAPASASGAAPLTADQAKERAKQLVPGDAFYAHELDEGEEHLWDVRVRLAGGQEVKILLFREGGALDELGAEEGPFDYDLPAPMTGMMTLAQARAKALEAKAGNVQVWEFHAANREYEFYVRDAASQLWEIKMTGDAGAITTVEAKDAVD